MFTFTGMAGRPPEHDFNTLEIGQKTQLLGKAKNNPHQYIWQYNQRAGRRLKLIHEGKKLFVERIA